MRSGELTVPAGTSFDPSIHLTPLDVTIDSMVNPTALKIHLKASKTDQSREGADLYVGRTYNPLCPVVAMLRYLAVRGFDQGPLFRLSDGKPLTRPLLVERVRGALGKAGVEATHYSGHSFRIGAATTAAANRVSDATIQLLGRWRSDSYCQYILTPRGRLSNVSRILTQ